MAQFVVEFSPPVKTKSKQNDDINTEIHYCLVLAPFQKQTQVEFSNIKIKNTAVRFLTVINPLDKPRQFILPSLNDGIYFDVYEFTLQPNSQRELSITWKPSVCGNMRKLIKIEQVDNNRKYDFVILGNCIDPSNKKFRNSAIIYPKSKNLGLIKKPFNCSRKKIMLNKAKAFNSKSERIVLVGNITKLSETVSSEFLQTPVRRQTYLVGEKENVPNIKQNTSRQNFTDSQHSIKRPDKKRQDQVFNNHFNIQYQSNNCSLLSDDSLDEPLKIITDNSSPFNDFCLTPLKSTENLLSPFSTTKKCKSFNVSDEKFDFTPYVSPFMPINASTGAKNFTPEERKPTRISVNLCNKFQNTPRNNFKKSNSTFIKDNIDSKTFITSPKTEQSFDFSHKQECISTTPIHKSSNKILSSSKPKRPSFLIKNSPYYRCSPKSSLIFKNRLKQYSIPSPRAKRLKTPKLDKCDQYLRCLANPVLVYHNNVEDPFFKMSQYYEAEWLDRQESDMIRWLNALLMPTDKLEDVEQAAVAWEEASKTNYKNKPMQFATQKDLFAAQIYRQSPQQWSALRKATSNLITSTSVATVLSKLAISIEKDFITVRDDRQIHLDLNLKKKITDMLKCYNPLWLRIGLEAIYGQIILIKQGSNDLDGLGWFIRKHLFNNDYVKQKFTKINILQVNLPSYNIAMKKFILKKILMLIYFLDRAKEQQLIRHNPCLFKIDSPYKSSYEFLMGFCADMVTSHGDITRRMRGIEYNLTHKQTHLDEVDYAVKSLNDLRDGVRITKVVEILFKGDPLSQKLRLPAISKLQKIHNVNLALIRISEHINIEGNITKRDIVNGHREKILSLFWQIIYKYLTPQYNKAAIQIQNWWRKSSLKFIVMKRIRIKQILKRNLAAIKIQAFVRGYLTRKNWPLYQHELIENRKKLHLASTLIKHYFQKKLKLLTEERKEFIILKRTTIFVQRKFRSKQAMKKNREQYLKIRKSTLLIQKVFRGFIIRKNWQQIKCYLVNEKIRRIEAINIIKRTLRKNSPPTKNELYFKKLIKITLTIQRRFRANKLMKIQMERFALLKKSAIVIQQRFRAKQAMIQQKEHYCRLKNCTLKLQAVARGYIVRKHWPALSSKLQAKKMYLVVSSDIIKRAMRTNLPITYDRVHFLDLKNLTIIIQRRFRANRKMRLQREKYLQLKSVTLKLQSMARGYILRKRWPMIRDQLQTNRMHLINCSNIIKKCLRKNLPVTKDRHEYIRLKTAVIVLQKRFRNTKLMKNERENYIKLKVNVIKLQSLVRGYIVRKKWPSLYRELQANKMHLIKCSNIIKRALRSILPVPQDRIDFLKLKLSAIVFQTKFRALRDMKLQREKYLQLKVSTIKLQSMIRGYIIRKHWQSLQNDLIANRQILFNSSDIIKRALRKNLPMTNIRLRFLELKRATLIVQNRFRINKQVKEYQTLRYNVIVIQRRFKANMAMKRQKQMYINTKVMVIKLQSYIRGYLVRKNWPTTKCVLETNRKQLITASNTIKKFYRQCLPPTSERLRYLQLRQSVINVQARYRANISMKLAEREYLLLKYCVLILQRHYRAYKAMMIQKQQYNNLKKGTIKLQAYIRGYLARKNWPELKRSMEIYQKESIAAIEKLNFAATKIQAVVRGFLLRKRLPQLKYELQVQKLARAATLIQALWRGYRIRKRIQCRRQTIRIPKKSALTLGRRHNDVVDVLKRQKINEYSYKELATVFWNLDTCTSLSKELCLKTAKGVIVDYIFRFLQFSNQSQPSIEAREPAIRVLTNLLKFQETSWHIWIRTVNANMVKELIKIMKTCCGKICANKLYCSIATWIWIALQDPEKKLYFKDIPNVIIDLKFMMDTLNKKYKTRKMDDKKKMFLPSARPTWSIGSKCQKCFDSDFYATSQLCKLLNM